MTRIIDGFVIPLTDRRIHAKHAPGKFFELEASPRCYGYGKEKASGRSGACKTVSRVSKKIVEQSSGVSFFDHPVAPSYALSCYKGSVLSFLSAWF